MPKKILLVDDEPEILEICRDYLKASGYDVVTASDGAQGLFAARREKPDLVVLDLMMPVMDGWEFRRVQQADPKLARVPTIVLSALDQARAVDLRPAAFLKKPLDFDLLLQLVREYCH